MSNLNDFDVVVIQKQTALERYTKRDLNISFLDYLSQDGQNKEQLNFAHEEHTKSRKLLIKTLQALNLSYILLNLDELRATNLPFFNENKAHSGICPKKNIVISLGGDGTLLHASHYVGNSVELLGINSCPQNSVGHLCYATPDNMEKVLYELFQLKKYKIEKVRRLRVSIENYNNIPLVLNDILVSHLHPAATSRYQISVLNFKNEVLQTQKQLSSGLWVSTAAGSTAAIASYGFPAEKLNSSKILVACREPYAIKGEVCSLNKFTIEGDSQFLTLFSRMRQGLVCLDGPDFSLNFCFGEHIEVRAPVSGTLCLLR